LVATSAPTSLGKKGESKYPFDDNKRSSGGTCETEMGRPADNGPANRWSTSLGHCLPASSAMGE
jgi:hypothetical protein